MKDKKFIMVQDEITANKLLEGGFQLVSKNNNTYIFMNVVPQHFNFNNIDIKKITYTNILSI